MGGGGLGKEIVNAHSSEDFQHFNILLYIHFNLNKNVFFFKVSHEILETQGSIIRGMMLKDGIKWLWHKGKTPETTAQPRHLE